MLIFKNQQIVHHAQRHQGAEDCDASRTPPAKFDAMERIERFDWIEGGMG